MATRKAKTPAALSTWETAQVQPLDPPSPEKEGRDREMALAKESAPPPILDPPSAPIEFLDTHAEIQKELRALCGLSFAAQKHVFELRRLIFGDGNCID